jgi:hypothetical protein
MDSLFFFSQKVTKRCGFRKSVGKVGEWREEGQCGRTVESIEQPIVASAFSPFGVLESLCLVHHSRYRECWSEVLSVFARSSITCDHIQLEANEQGRFCKNLGDRSC